MKKSLLALAVLGAFAGAASAQSSVTVYGSVDMGIAKGNGGTAVGPGSIYGLVGGAGDNGSVSNNVKAKAYQVKQSTPSRLGFRGNEDIGGGLSAQFQIEHRFTPDDGNSSTAANQVFWQGRTYVQLSSATLGRIYLGREYTAAFWVSVKSDPFGQVGVGQLGAGPMYAGFSSPSPAAVNSKSPVVVRASNSIGYKSPAISGLTVQAQVGLGEGVTSRTTGFNVEYGAGPIYAGLGYEKLNKGPAVTDGDSLVNLAFQYDFGMVKPMLYYARAKISNGVSGGVLSNKYFSIGALAPIGGGTLKVAYGRLTPDSNIGVIGLRPGRETKFGLGFDYPLSKRTNLYLDGSTTRKSGTVTAAPGSAEFTNNNIVGFGVNHTF